MPEPIAVVGSSCRFPGGASSPSKLWQLLEKPRDVLSDIPKERLGLGAFYHEDGEHHGSTNVVAKAYLVEEDPRLFDGPFFNINPKEADAMDPQQRLMLESVYECIESAGYPLDRLQGSATSVYVGCMTNDYHDIQGRDIEIVNRYHGTGSTRSILSNRISYFFDFRGPSVTLDTACSSSLAALHFAVQSLRNGESSSAIVGGVNLIFDSVAYISESKLHMLSPTSRSSMWDASADGYARGEGVSALMLKTLSQALADGDHIECIIRETGMNQDGRTTGMTMPSGEAQATLIRETYARAGLDLRSRSDRPQYFEAHGTGTLAGDPQEARGIYSAFFDQPTRDGNEEETLFCGSIKTVIGHLEGCAGLAGLMKASLAVQHGVIPPNMLFQTLNPEITPYYHRLQVPTEALAWPAGTSLRRASVNSFGFGGTNVHAIIEQYVPPVAPAPTTPQQTSSPEGFFAGPLLLSAGTGPSLAASIDRLADMLEAEKCSLRIEDVAFFTQTRRTTFQQRISFPGGSTAGLIEALRTTTRSAVAASEIGVRAPAKLKWHSPGILGIFTGQGAQWATMGRDMVNRCHTFRQSIEACEATLCSLPDAPTWSLTQELFREQSGSRLHEAALSQPLCTAIQIALVDTLAAAGISFRGVVGHSSGEIAATYAAGLLSAEDAMRVAYYRGLHAHLARGEQGQSGAMLAVGLGIDDAEAFCQPFNGRLSVAASNSPTSTTLSGDEDAILSAKELLDKEKTFARMLKVDTAYHSSHMLPCATPYLDSLRACHIQVRPPNDDCIWISSVHGHAELLDDAEDLQVLADEYWVANMCQPVLFSEAVECSLWRAGPFDVAIEVGAHPALKGPATQTMTAALGANATFPYTATLQRGRNDVEAFSASLGSLWTTLGTWVDFNGWRRAYGGPDSAPTVTTLKNMPSYSWSHEQVHWKESRLSRRYRLAERAPHELLGRRVADDSEMEMRWRNIMKVNELPWIRGHVFQRSILFATVGYVALAIEAAAEIAGLDRIKLIEVRDLVIPRALVLDENDGGVETIFSVRRKPSHSDTTIEADFACQSSVNGGNLEENCSGRLIIELFSPEENADNQGVPLLPARCPPRSGTTLIDGEAYYKAIFNTTGLDYQGLFRGMKHIRRTLGFSSAYASWPVEEVGNRYLFHPGLLDVAMQSILAAFVNPTRIPIRGSFLPSALSRLVFDPHARAVSDDGTEVVFESDCFLTNNTPRSFEGDIHVFGPSQQCLLHVEGFRMDNWAEPKANEDRPVFSRLHYQPDLFYTNSNHLPELDPDRAELHLIEAINRASFYYLRSFFSSVSDDQVDGWTWDRQAFYTAVKHVLQQTADGRHPVTKKSWVDDTAALMEEYKQLPAFHDQADMKAVHVAGKHLAQVMAGDERPLEVYLREGVWGPLYSHGRYQVRLNRTIADLVSTFAHRFPRAKYLEVGAGSGGTTLGVLDQLGDALSQYTFTDVSAGFFEKAREKLAHTDAAAAERVAYKVLDLERDPLEQGFEAESQDVIIAANVLHATADMAKAVRNVRRLLKPGGYMFMLEVTGEYLEGLLLMGPLEGWWLGNREGKASQPGLTLQGWEDLLQESGFTGVDKHQSDVPDPRTQAVSVVVTQATDKRVDMLREPLEFLDDLPVSDQVLIVGGKSLAMSKTVRVISQHVARFAGQVQVVQSVDDIDPDTLTTGPVAVLALCDLERSFFADPVTEPRLKRLQALFARATDVLWVTPGHLDDQDPSSAMMIGLCRTMAIELEQLNLQFLNTNVKGSKGPDARFIVEAFVRLRLSPSPGFAASPIVWSTEPELTLTANGDVLIPRLKPDVERNNRLNSSARHITKPVRSIDMTSHSYTAVSREGHIHLEENSPWLPPAHLDRLKIDDTITIRTTISLTLPHSSSATLLAGFDGQSRPMLALANAHSSLVSVPLASALVLESATPITAHQLRVLAHLILAKYVLEAIPGRASPRRSHVVIHGASAALAEAIIQLDAGQSHFIFTHSPSKGEATSHGLGLHPRSSTYVLQRMLPSNISFVVALDNKGDDAITSKLLSIFQGTILDLDALILEGRAVPLADSKSLINDSIDGKKNEAEVKQSLPIPAYSLPTMSTSSLHYPAVVDWSVNDEHPLQITVNPIHGRGLFSPDKSYLMVSLVSTMGRSICRWMVENGARHIALASRSAQVDPTWLEEMAHLGADIRVYRMDVSDRDSVRDTVATMRAEMPPIAGVANAALVLRDRPFLDMQAADMTEVLAPKVDGSLHLHEEFQDATLDFFVLFSTLSCVIGNAGQSNYDAASLYQVMLAKHRRQQGLAASVMEVGAVADVGYVAERGQALFDKLARTMKLALSESDVHHIFAEAVAASPIREGEVVDSTTAEIVSGMGHYTYNANTPSEAHPPWFNNLLASHYVREEGSASAVVRGTDANHLSVADQLDAIASEEEAAAILTQALAGRVETMLQMSAGSFRVDASLLDVGIDSLLAVELRTWFLKQIHVDVPVLKILSGESGEAVCAYAATQYMAEKGQAETVAPDGGSRFDAPTSEPDGGSAASLSSSESRQSGSSEAGDSASTTTISTLDTGDEEAVHEEDTKGVPAEVLESTAAMTHAQARLWVADHMSSNRFQNNNVLTYDVHGFVHVGRVGRAVAAVVAHHPGLHTCFFQDATHRPQQGLLKAPEHCFRHIPASAERSDNHDIVRSVQDELRTREWRLQRGEVLEIVLISHSSVDHTMLIGFHHIAMDGSAWRTFFRDLHMAYQGVALGMPGKSPFDVATEEQAAHDAVDVSTAYWQHELSPLPEPFPLLSFASAKTRPPLDGYSNHMKLIQLDGATAEHINTISRSLNVTSVNFYLAAMQSLLTLLSSTEDMCIGVTDSGRDVETAESIGFFLNLLPLRLRSTGSQSFRDLIQQVNTTYRNARTHSTVPFDAIMDSVGVSRDSTHPPLFQVAFDVRHGQDATISLGNCQMTICESVDSALPYDIVFCVVPMPAPGPSYVQVLTRTDLYSQEATELLAHMYITLLGNLVRTPDADVSLGRLQIYPDIGVQKALDFGAPRAKVFADWPSTITERMDRIFRTRSSRIAVKDVAGSLTYEELSRSVLSLATRLLPYQGQRIAVLCDPQRTWVIGMLAIFRIGAAFISLDSTLPPARLAGMIRACDPRVVLSHAATNDLAAHVLAESGSAAPMLLVEDGHIAAEEVANVERPSTASVIICTSGSTGVPKAILLSSRGFINFLANQEEVHGVRDDDVILQQSNLGFDMAIAQALLALTHGCTLVMAPAAMRGDPVAVTDLMEREDVTFTFACPTEYQMWIRFCRDTVSRLRRWRLAQCGGEKVPDSLRRAWRHLPHRPVFADVYGPSEISVCVSMEHHEGGAGPADPLAVGAPSVGRPLANVGIFIVDAYGHLCPPGIAGEVCVTGVGVALGYIDAAATATAFVDDFPIDCGNGTTLSPGRMYRTGDRAVWRSDGTLGFVGRMRHDTVVKIRGMRVDLTDVENAIVCHGSGLVSEAVVTFHQHNDDDAFLVAHVLPAAAAAAVQREEGEWERLMHGLSLPRHMKPRRVVVLAHLPTSANGKVDRASLSRAAAALPPRQALTTPPHALEHAAAITTLRQLELHLLWARVLHRADIPRRTDVDFWAMGASSLHLVQLQAAIRHDMRVPVSIRDIFMYSTLGSMADMITHHTAARPVPEPIDWERETSVPEELRRALASRIRLPPPRDPVSGHDVLLTGADGFLGRQILHALLRTASIHRVHCIAMSSSPPALDGVDAARVIIYEGSSMQQHAFGLDADTITRLAGSVDRIIVAGSYGHCLHHYASLRQPNVSNTKLLATWASPRRIPLHFVSSGRVTLLSRHPDCALPPVSVQDSRPNSDGSEGLTASKWAAEVFLERVAAQAEDLGFPITVHRPCALVGDNAPAEDTLNAILRYSSLMRAVPRLSNLSVSGYFDFAPVADIAARIVGLALDAEQPPRLRFRHHSGGVRVAPRDFRGHMEKVYATPFAELDLEEWMERALGRGLEPMIAVYLRAIVESGKTLVFPFMGHC